ncbi:hypothetical protein CSKR_110561 [Clonorchis sinensis]|uniref:Uncharacterized protein n=1 Tax=Clonorchis sinensis TaxID=79923 RepID=A0A3R7D5C3_CLOSI|nr:hypothetical protein CSKR_110561 [Clonorchis sinensis]
MHQPTTTGHEAQAAPLQQTGQAATADETLRQSRRGPRNSSDNPRGKRGVIQSFIMYKWSGTRASIPPVARHTTIVASSRSSVLPRLRLDGCKLFGVLVHLVLQILHCSIIPILPRLQRRQ